MSLYHGGNPVTDSKLGSGQVTKVMRGGELVWQKGGTLRNLWDGNYKEGVYLSPYADGVNFQYRVDNDSNKICVFQKFWANTTFTVKTWDDHNRAGLIVTMAPPTNNKQYPGAHIGVNDLEGGADWGKNLVGPINGYTFTTGEETYLTLFLSNTGQRPQLTITLGDTIPTKYIPPGGVG